MNQTDLKLRQDQAEAFTHAEVDANWTELENRTKHSEDGYNSMAEVGAKLKTLVESSTEALPPIIDPPYANIAAMLADQGSQVTGYIYEVTDASADPNIGEVEVAFYKKKASSTATLADDYQPISDTEILIIQQSTSNKVFGVQAVQSNTIPIDEVANNKIAFEYDEVAEVLTAAVFNKKFSDSIVNIVAHFANYDYLLRIYNSVNDKYYELPVTGFATVNVDYTIATLGGNVPSTDEIDIGAAVDVMFMPLRKDNPSKFLGTYISLANLQAAHPTASAGNYADVDTGVSSDVQRYIWDINDTKWVAQAGAGGTTEMDAMTQATVVKTTPVDADTFAVSDSEAAGVFKALSWANIKATLKTYFDTLYVAVSNLKTQAITGTRVTASVSSTYAINLSNGDVFVLTMTADTTFSFSNLPTGTNTKTFEVLLTGAFTPTFPAYAVATPSSDTYDGAVRNRYIFDVINGTSSSEDIITTIENLAS